MPLFGGLMQLRREQMCDRVELMLFDILQELKNISGLLQNENSKPIEKKPNGKECSYCGKVHERPVDYAICAKKHKRKV